MNFCKAKSVCSTPASNHITEAAAVQREGVVVRLESAVTASGGLGGLGADRVRAAGHGYR